MNPQATRNPYNNAQLLVGNPHHGRTILAPSWEIFNNVVNLTGIRSPRSYAYGVHVVVVVNLLV